MFDDRNEQLLSDLIAKHPSALSLEMETFHLLDLARCSLGTVVAAACVIALADRTTNDFLDGEWTAGWLAGWLVGEQLEWGHVCSRRAISVAPLAPLGALLGAE